MEKRENLEPFIRQEWMKRSKEKRTENDVLIFCLDLQNRRPDLMSFKYSGGDKCNSLYTILRELIE